MENNNRESFAAAAAAAVASAATDSKHTLTHREANKQPSKPDREIEREKRTEQFEQQTVCVSVHANASTHVARRERVQR